MEAWLLHLQWLQAVALLLLSGCVRLALAEGKKGAREDDGERLCVLVEKPESLRSPRGGFASPARQIRMIKRTWASEPEDWRGDKGQRNVSVFFITPGQPPPRAPGQPRCEVGAWERPGGIDFAQEGLQMPPGLDTWWRWGKCGLPPQCGWLVKVALDTYINIERFEDRLRCLATDPQLQYLGMPKIVALPADNEKGVTNFRVAEKSAGIVMRRSLMNKLPYLLDACMVDEGFRHTFIGAEDLAIGTCLWFHGIEIHPWMDPGEEVYWNQVGSIDPSLAVPKGSRYSATYQLVIEKQATQTSLGGLQCVFLVTDVWDPQEMEQLFLLAGKSRRWFKNIACVPGGFSFPELTGATSGSGLREPIFSPAVRSTMQQCLLQNAFARLTPRVPAGSGVRPPMVASPAELAQEWRTPKIADGRAAEILSQGGHSMCVFVTTTTASEKHTADAEAVLKTWAKLGGQDGPDDVKVFLVGRENEGPDDKVLRLRGDVDLGFLFNSIRVFYLWRYLAAHHAKDCKWFVKVDADTFVNTWALRERLTRYFNAEESHYKGTLKVTRLGSGREMKFAYNIAILSSGLLQEASHWFQVCLDDCVKRKLGKGAEDIDLAYCLEQHGKVAASRVGATQEVRSRGMLLAASTGGGGDASAAAKAGDEVASTKAEDGRQGGRDTRLLAAASGACTLFVHPVHADELTIMHQEVLEMRAEASATPSTQMCDWPKDVHVDRTGWDRYMAQTYRGVIDCWLGDFNWMTCCDPNLWGDKGNPECWDEEHTYDRCCAKAKQDLADKALAKG
eukprot:TRINITY_DN54031_c0_g1_i1.p1 TRINITY_DN54031_c0_g1~~TRINITY_DN54031_c0_g1_i1.p1  ORF type:complete len:789 (-),score=201.97 TRINITY_DN54031_c0_g1_i1:510-2876(-)